MLAAMETPKPTKPKGPSAAWSIPYLLAWMAAAGAGSWILTAIIGVVATVFSPVILVVAAVLSIGTVWGLMTGSAKQGSE